MKPFAALVLFSASLGLLLSGCYVSHEGEGRDAAIVLMDSGRVSCGRGGSCPAGTQCCVFCDDSLECVPEGTMCPPGPTCGRCASNGDCAPSQYCYTPDLSCAASGECLPRPEECSTECVGVCGCDGEWYCNSCVAGQSGVNTAPPERCGGSTWDEVCLPFCLRVATCFMGPTPEECPLLCEETVPPDTCSEADFVEIGRCAALDDCFEVEECLFSIPCLSDGGGMMGGGGAP